MIIDILAVIVPRAHSVRIKWVNEIAIRVRRLICKCLISRLFRCVKIEVAHNQDITFAIIKIDIPHDIFRHRFAFVLVIGSCASFEVCDDAGQDDFVGVVVFEFEIIDIDIACESLCDIVAGERQFCGIVEDTICKRGVGSISSGACHPIVYAVDIQIVIQKIVWQGSVSSHFADGENIGIICCQDGADISVFIVDIVVCCSAIAGVVAIIEQVILHHFQRVGLGDG